LIFAGVRIFMHRHPVQSSIPAKDKIIVSLDVATVEASRGLIDQIGGQIGFFKVGSQLFTATGPAIIDEIRASGSKIFLDLKFHDIPNTVRRAVESACALGVDMLTIHLSGGRSMCEAAVVGRGMTKTLILGVTVLTSLNDESIAEVGFRTSVEDEVLLLADLAKHVGITGLIASPLELVAIRNRFGSLFTTVIPGIRPHWSETRDQNRTMTPAEALNAGADYLVIGRPITAAPDPLQAANRIIDELSSVPSRI
jgi:orotidine-5'-phosphate decarboxylase